MKLWIGRFVALILGQLAGSLVATSLVTGLTRTAVFLVVLPLITTLLCTTDYFRSKGSILTVVVGTLATFGSIHVLRMYVDSSWLVGPLPRDAVLTVYAAITIITVVFAGSACVVCSSTGVLRKSRWFVVGAMAISLIGLAVVARQSVQELSPSKLLRTIVRLEQSETKDSSVLQELSTMLAICGREADAKMVFRSIVSGGDRTARSVLIALMNSRCSTW